jgi:putative copper export protein
MMAVILEIIGFLASFWMLGALGFRYGILRASPDGPADAPRTAVFRRAAARAAGVGVLGVLLGVASLVTGLMKRAEQKHLSLGGAFSAGGVANVLQASLLGALLVAFVLAIAPRTARFAWPIAALAGLAFALRNLISGNLAAMVNPLHVLGASLWIGTLFVLVVCGIVSFIGASLSTEEREPAVALMVHRFSLVALLGAGVLATTGVVTAWTHLKHLDALWTTGYGQALLWKLLFVAVVLALGAWNWRRVGPALGKEGGARKIRTSAAIELAVAAVVVVLTGVLVTTPSPKPPQPPGAAVTSHELGGA